MEILRPLIFLAPISETLSKLKSVIEPSAEKENIEIFDIEAIDEAEVLFRQIGQSLVLVSNPKLCVMLIKAHKKLIKRLKIKIILLSKSPISKNALDKLMKAGLTENIVEPVAPKTLIYKVRLHLRSIQPERKAKEMVKKFDKKKKQSENQNENENEKKLEKKNLTSHINNTLKGKIANKNNKTNDNDVDFEIKQSNQKEIGGHYRGNLKDKEIESIEDNKKIKSKSNLFEEEKPSKEKTIQQEILELEEELKNKKTKKYSNKKTDDFLKGSIDNQFEDDDIKDIQKRVKKLQENELEAKQKKSSTKIQDPLNDQKKKSNHQSSLIKSEQHYRGEIGDSNDDNLDDYSHDSSYKESQNKNKTNKSNYSEKLGDGYLKQKELSQETDNDEQNKNKNSKLNLLDQKNEKNKKLSKEEDIQEKKKRKQNDINNTKERNDKNDVFEDEDIYSRKKRKKQIEIESSLPYKQAKKEEELEKKRQKSTSQLNIEKKEDREKELDQDRLDELRELRNAKKIDLDDDDLKELMAKLDEEKLKRKHSKWDETQKKKEHRSNYREESKTKNNKSNYSEAIADKESNKSDAHADNIKTHYSNKEGIDHTDDEWNSYWLKKQKEQEKIVLDGDSIFYEKKELGEQTIDYRKIKESFEGISSFGSKKTNIINLETTRDKKNKKENNSNFDNVAIDSNGSIKQNDEDDSLSFDDISDSEAEDFFEPNTFGFEHVISVMDSYQSEKSDLKTVAQKISKIIFEKFNAYTMFYSYNKNIESYHIEHNSFMNIKMPSLPTEPIKNKVSKSEYKILLKEYKEDKKMYKQESEEIIELWNEQYSSDEESWKQQELPFWKDHRFIEDTQQFIYPIKEGLNKIGFIAVVFEKNISQDDTKIIEIILETSRGLFLEWSHKSMQTSENYNQKIEKTKMTNKVTNLFKGISSFFTKKKAA